MKKIQTISKVKDIKSLDLITLLFLLFMASSAYGQRVDITGDATVSGQFEVMDTILFSDGTTLASACLQVLQDADSDTKIEVEKLADEDIIRFTINGQEIARFENNRLELADGGGSVFIGYKAGENDDASNNKSVYIGYEAGQMSNGFGNVAIGANSMTENMIGQENTAVGASAGYQSIGSQNVFVGRDAGRSASTSSSNTYLGHRAGRSAIGSGNIFIGKSAGENQTGSHKLVIDNSTTLTPLIYGEFDNNLLRVNGTLDINDEYTFPEVNGATGQILSYDGAGALQWVYPGATSSFADADGDTKIQVEETADEDKIRFDVGGYEAMYLDTVAGNGRFNIDAYTFLQKPLTLYSSDLTFSNLTSSEELGIRFGTGSLGFKMLYSAQGLGNNKVNFQYTQFASTKDLMTWDDTGNVGIGTQEPVRKLHVSTDTPTGHVMRIENTSSGTYASGLEVVINRVTTGANNNFITFRDSDGVAGRIEGFNTSEGNDLTDFPDIDFSAYFNPVIIGNVAFNEGSLPTISGGKLPSLSLTMPSLNYQLPTLNYTPPVLSGGIASYNTSAMINCVVSGGINCSNPFSWTPISWNEGNLSWNQGNIDWTPGTYSWNRGSLPTITGGQLPSFDIDALLNPVPIISAVNDFKNVICWALENGERSLITTNPWDLAMLQNASYLSNLADCKNGGVTYGSGGADYAEYLLRENLDEIIKEGQIVGVRGGKISKNTENAEQLLVISMMPIVLGNMPDDTLTLDQYEKVAFLGQAPVWVIGQVRSGDYIIPSGRNDGYGLAVDPAELKVNQVSEVIGRAWMDADQAVNLVNMVIGLKTNEMASILSGFSEDLSKLDNRLSRVEALLGTDDLVSKE